MHEVTIGSAYRCYSQKEIVVRPWGNFEVLHPGNRFRVKIITVNPGHRLSLQMHRWRDELWYVVEGAGNVYQEKKDYKTCFNIIVGSIVEIHKGEWHRVANYNKTPLVFIEVQTGDCFEEDIERREDDYGRN